MEEQIESLRQELAACQEAQKRALADYHNLVRRTQEERSIQREQAGRDLMLDLLPTVDHLVLAQSHLDDPAVKLIADDLQKVLAAHGLEAMPTIGQEFDPNRMEAVATAAGPKDEVLSEEESGYLLNGKVLRPAKVIVGRE
jgi:molecular chaperone GrpE